MELKQLTQEEYDAMTPEDIKAFFAKVRDQAIKEGIIKKPSGEDT